MEIGVLVLLLALSVLFLLFFKEYEETKDRFSTMINNIMFRVSELPDTISTTFPPEREIDTRTYDKIMELLSEINVSKTMFMAFKDLAVFKDEAFEDTLKKMRELLYMLDAKDVDSLIEMLANNYYYNEDGIDNRPDQES